MKSIFKSLPLAITSLIFVSFFSSCHSSEEPIITEQEQTLLAVKMVTNCLMPDTTNELEFDLTNHPKPEGEGNFEISEFNATNIYAISGASLPLKLDVVLNDHFCTLRDSAYFLRKRSSALDSSAGALRLCFGLNATKDSIVILYQPLALISPTVTADTIRYTIYEGTNPQFYQYASAGFSAIRSTAACKEYTTYIRLKHKQSDAPKKFQAGSDVESVLFSFQEIGQLIYDNPTNHVTVWNAFSKKPGSPATDSLCYHSLLLGPDSLIGPFPFFGPFPNKFANLAHLCPPNCGEVAFRLKQK